MKVCKILCNTTYIYIYRPIGSDLEDPEATR